jgi:hypothetical protein
VTYALWFSGVYIDKTQFFARLAVDSETFFDVYPEFILEPDQSAAFKRERRSGITKRFVGAQIGQQIKFGGNLWSVVGIFDSDGSGFDSEAWGDLNQIGDAFKRSSFSTVTFRLKNPGDLSDLVTAFDGDNRLQYFVPKREKKIFRGTIRDDGEVYPDPRSFYYDYLQHRCYDYDVWGCRQPDG